MLAVVNKSIRMSNADASTATRACAHQLRYDAAPAWAKAPTGVVFYVHEDHVPPGAWRIVIFDDADQAGALGWHSEGPDGLPFGRVFVGPVLDNGGDALTKALSVASVLSHEVLEAFVDPTVNLSASAPNGDLWALEVGDPVESDSYAVPVSQRDGSTTLVSVSDFVTPAFFDDSPTAGSKFSHMGTPTAPFKLAPGGYAIVNGQAVWGERYPTWRRTLKETEFLEARAVRASRRSRLRDDHDKFEGLHPLGRSARFVAPNPTA